MFDRNKPWKYCLSLGAAAWIHSFLLAAAGAWNLVLFLGVFPLKRSLTEAAVIAYTRRSVSVASALRIGFLSLSITLLLVSLLTDIALCLKSKRIAYTLCWLNIFTSFLGLVLLMYLWTAFGILLLSTNATVGELVIWGNIDLLYIILTAAPMTHVYASLGNVYAAGGSGFEGLGFRELVVSMEDAEKIEKGKTLNMGSLGTWNVGLTLEHASILFSLFCLCISVLNFSIFWVKISDDPLMRMSSIGILFLIEGLFMFSLSIFSLAATSASSPFFSLSAAFLSILILPLNITLIFMLTKRLLQDIQNIHRKILLTNYAGLHALGAQVVYTFIAFFAFVSLYSLFYKQTTQYTDTQQIQKEKQHIHKINLEEERQKLLPETDTLNP